MSQRQYGARRRIGPCLLSYQFSNDFLQFPLDSGADHAYNDRAMAEPDCTVLIVSDQPEPDVDALGILEAAGFAVQSACTPHAKIEQFSEYSPQVVLLDFQTGNPSERKSWIDRGRTLWPAASFVVVTAQGDTKAVGVALKEGAHRTLTRPVTPETLRLVVTRSQEHALLREDVAHVARRPLSLVGGDAIIGRHPLMQELLKRVAHVAPKKATALIHGESGTGKELIASALHQNSLRRNGPFVALNCASLSETLLESELFGHERGAFTGATAKREGRFKHADGGTLFLDEVSEIPLSLQVKLLRFLQERKFERVGSNEPISVDVRIVAATNKNLKALVDDRMFREDLYYRLNVVRLEIPPLRTRTTDILPLAEHFLMTFAEEEEVEAPMFSEAAKSALLEYPWPGNVRELQNAIEQAFVMTESATIEAEDLPIAVPADGPLDALRLMIPGATLAEIERYAILKTLDAVSGSTAKAAAILGTSRRTIQYRLKEWGLQGRSNRESSSSGEAPAEEAFAQSPGERIQRPQ